MTATKTTKVLIIGAGGRMATAAVAGLLVAPAMVWVKDRVERPAGTNTLPAKAPLASTLRVVRVTAQAPKRADADRCPVIVVRPMVATLFSVS